MRLGLFNTNTGAWQSPEAARRLARHAEVLGYDSLWGGEHVVVPSPRVPPSPMEPTTPLLDPLLSLAFLASATERILLATGILIVPQRNPVLLAKELATLDVLSGGRLLVGIGTGYLEPEFRAVGVPFEERGARTDEYLRAMRTLWSSPAPAFGGRFVSFGGVDAYPRPLDPAGPPIYVGGHSRAALRRAARYGQGWFGMFLTLEETAGAVAGLRAALGEVEREVAGEAPRLTVTPKGRLTPERVAAYADLGVERLVLFPSVELDEAAMLTYLDDNAPHRLVA